jgi:hypothetical protein
MVKNGRTSLTGKHSQPAQAVSNRKKRTEEEGLGQLILYLFMVVEKDCRFAVLENPILSMLAVLFKSLLVHLKSGNLCLFLLLSQGGCTW